MMAAMTMANPMTPGTYRTNTEILTRRGGVFWGLVLLLFGILWFLHASRLVDLGTTFMNVAIPLLLIIAGLYLVVVKLMR